MDEYLLIVRGVKHLADVDSAEDAYDVADFLILRFHDKSIVSDTFFLVFVGHGRRLAVDDEGVRQKEQSSDNIKDRLRVFVVPDGGASRYRGDAVEDEDRHIEE